MIRYERKIANAATKPIDGAKVEPTSERKGGTLTVGGGELEVIKEKHKDWEQVIAKDLEIPSNFHTMTFEKVIQSAINVPVGEFGHMAVAASGNCTINVKKPQALPEEQWIPKEGLPEGAERHRYRVFSTTLYIYYSGPATLSLADGIQYGFDGYKLVTVSAPTEPTDPPAEEPTQQSTEPPAEESPVAGEPGAPQYALEKLFKHYTEEQREAGTADLFLLTYDERIGRAIISPIALAQPNAADPTNPIDGEDDPEDEDEEEEDKGDREDKPQPPDDGEGSYTDENGNPLIPTPPPPRPGSPPLIALHRAGLSISGDGGATWMYRQIRGLTEDPEGQPPEIDENGEVVEDPALGSRLVDIAGTQMDGVFLLCADGTVMHARMPYDNFVERKIGDDEAQEVQISVVNGDFENESLEPWVLKTGTLPLSLDLTDPPQLSGSKRYLASAAPGKEFRIEQPIFVPEVVRAQIAAIGSTTARVEADIYLDPGAIAAISLGKPYAYIRSSGNILGWSFGGLNNGRYEDSVVYLAGGSGYHTQVYITPIAGTMTGSGTAQTQVFSAGAHMRISWGNLAEAFAFKFHDLDEGQIIRFRRADVLDYNLEAGVTRAEIVGDYIEFSGASGPVGTDYNTRLCFVDICVRKNAEFWTSSGNITFGDTSWKPSGNFGTVNAIGSAVATGAQTGKDPAKNWQKISFDFLMDQLGDSGFFLAIEGKGTGTVYYDNVRIYAGQNAKPIVAIATSNVDSEGNGARGVDLYDDVTHWTYRQNEWRGAKGLPFEPKLAEAGEKGSEFYRMITDGQEVALWHAGGWLERTLPGEATGEVNGACLVNMRFVKKVVEEPEEVETLPEGETPPEGEEPPKDPGMLGGPFVTTADGNVLHLDAEYELTSGKKYEQSVTANWDARRKQVLLTQDQGAIEAMTPDNTAQALAFVAQKPQPINATIDKRRTLVTERGMLFGYSEKLGDFCWTDDPQTTWKFGGGFAVKLPKNSDPFSEKKDEEEEEGDGGTTTPPDDGGTTTPPEDGGGTTTPPAPEPQAVEGNGGTTTPPPGGGTTPPEEPEDPRIKDPTAPKEEEGGLFRYPILKLFEWR
ncbi:hypothetical protein [Paracoccus sp. SSK6]|uniref:hypothetical protein n=1 Tax=Paracoccus sp. SSK6 TaxID=3143131 RepID=UPI00321AC37B